MIKYAINLHGCPIFCQKYSSKKNKLYYYDSDLYSVELEDFTERVLFDTLMQAQKFLLVGSSMQKAKLYLHMIEDTAVLEKLIAKGKYTYKGGCDSGLIPKYGANPMLCEFDIVEVTV